MDAFAIAASAAVLNCTVNSVYPLIGEGGQVRRDLNRRFFPRPKEDGENVYILWLNTSENHQVNAVWRPNHFVPLVNKCEVIAYEEYCKVCIYK